MLLICCKVGILTLQACSYIRFRTHVLAYSLFSSNPPGAICNITKGTKSLHCHQENMLFTPMKHSIMTTCIRVLCSPSGAKTDLTCKQTNFLMGSLNMSRSSWPQDVRNRPLRLCMIQGRASIDQTFFSHTDVGQFFHSLKLWCI